MEVGELPISLKPVIHTGLVTGRDTPIRSGSPDKQRLAPESNLYLFSEQCKNQSGVILYIILTQTFMLRHIAGIASLLF
jgi:hypothetical protein